MKTFKLLVLGLILFAATSSHAQISVNVNIGTAPEWGPSGYSEVEYYYLPDVEAYYDIHNSQFIYLGQDKWIRSKYLPKQYRGYDLYSGYKVVLSDYHGKTPYTHYKEHKVKYHKGYKGKPQKTIGYKKVTAKKSYHKEKSNKNNHKEKH